MKKILSATLVAMLAMSMGVLTSCSDDDDATPDDAADVVNFQNMTATVGADGQVTLSGTVESAAKLKKFYIEDANGKQVADLIESETKQKEDGNKYFITTIKPTTLSVAKYTFKAKCKDAETGKWHEFKYGTEYSFTCGTAGSTVGSYLVFDKDVSKTSNYKNPDLLGEDGTGSDILPQACIVLKNDNGIYLAPCSKANNQVIKGGCGLGYVSGTDQGFFVTKSKGADGVKTIATFTLDKSKVDSSSNEGEVTVSGVYYDSKVIDLNVDALSLTK